MRKLTMAAFSAAAMLASLPASAGALRGDAFITAMNGNTLSAKTEEGTPYKLYFLPGGQATLQQDSGKPLFGAWSLDKNGDVCLKWPKGAGAENGCYRVSVNGAKVTWSNKDGSHKGDLLGGVGAFEMTKAE